MAGKLPELSVSLELQSKAFQRGVDKANKSLDRMSKQSRKTNTAMTKLSKSAGRIGASMVAFGAAALSAFSVRNVKAAIDFADAIGKTSNVLGLTTRRFQEYGFAADRSGVATSQFNSNMTAFVKRVGEAKLGIGPLVSGLKNMDNGLLASLKNSTSQSQALELVAEAIKNAGSATEKAAIANAAFSRAGIGMVSMLQDGTAGLQALAAEASAAGAVMDESLIKTATIIKDKWDALSDVIGVKFKSALITAAAAVMQFFNAFTDLPALQAEIAETTEKLTKAEQDLAEANFLTVSGAELWVKTHKDKLASLKTQETQLLRIQSLEKLRAEGAGASGKSRIQIEITDFNEASKAMRSYEKSVMSAQLSTELIGDKVKWLHQQMLAGNITNTLYREELEKFSVAAGQTAPAALDAMAVAAGNLTSNAISGMVDAFIDGEKSFSNFATSFLKGILKMITQALIFKAIAGTAFGQALGFQSSPGVSTQSAGPAPNARAPGIGTFSLGAGPDVFTAGAASSRSQGGRAGGNTVVNVVNNSSAEITTNETESANGETTVEIMIADAVKREIKRGSFDSVNRSTYSLARVGY